MGFKKSLLHLQQFGGNMMQLADAELFQGITTEEVERMMVCFGTRTERCAAGKTVRGYRHGPGDVGILISGALSI